MKQILLSVYLILITVWVCVAQQPAAGTEKNATDSLVRAKMVADSLKMEKLFAVAKYPLIKGSKWSGVIPVENPTEIPDPNMNYKLLFDMTVKNPDSLAGEINFSFDEIARILNIHVASGISPQNITPVIVIHGPGIDAVKNNWAYRKKHKIDNPNLKIIGDLENTSAEFIVCGQAMAYVGVEKNELLPQIKISLSAKTVISGYQLKGYVLYVIEPDR